MVFNAFRPGLVLPSVSAVISNHKLAAQKKANCVRAAILAISPQYVCKKFKSSCDVPEGWKKVTKCPKYAETRYYTCPNGKKVVAGKCYGEKPNLSCSMLMSPELKCPASKPPVVKGGKCQTAGEIKYFQCPSSSQIDQTPWCICGPESGAAGAKNKWQCQHLPELFCSGATIPPKSTPTVGSKRYPEGKCAPGEKINYKCADGTSVKWCECDDLGWDCGYIYKYPERLCPATKEITLDIEAGQRISDSCVLGEAVNKKCSDGRISRTCICEELGDTGKTAWECGMMGVCSKAGPPTIGGVSLSGSVTSDLSVELQTTPFGIIRITWMASEAVTSRLEYGPTTDYGFTAGTDYFDSAYQGAELSDLQPNISYHFRIRARDKDITPNTVVTEDYTFTIRRLPELLIQPISVDHFNGDTPNKIHVNILNNGVVTAPKGFVVKIYVDDKLVGEGPYDSDLASGASGEKVFDYIFSGIKGYVIIKAAVDATNLVTELNEKNNETRYDMSIYVPPTSNTQPAKPVKIE